VSNNKTQLEHIKSFAEKNMLAHLGIEITAVGDDYVCGKMPVDERTQQPFGLLHGGASAVLAESLGSIGANMLVDQSKYVCAGLEINANHVRPVKEGYVFGKAQAIHIGSTTQIWEIKISNADDKLVCISRITIAVISKQ
jgi:1,4-dihydroxy-2-naphthoyl-CoA hydrolase